MVLGVIGRLGRRAARGALGEVKRQGRTVFKSLKNKGIQKLIALAKGQMGNGRRRRRRRVPFGGRLPRLPVYRGGRRRLVYR